MDNILLTIASLLVSTCQGVCNAPIAKFVTDHLSKLSFTGFLIDGDFRFNFFVSYYLNCHFKLCYIPLSIHRSLVYFKTI